MNPRPIILGLMIGSVMSRAINGSAPFVPTVVAGAILVAMHWDLAVLAYHISWFGPLVKGNAVLLVQDGVIMWNGCGAEASQGTISLRRCV